MSELFQLFDSKRRQVGILDWGIKMTTLEDGEWEGGRVGRDGGRMVMREEGWDGEGEKWRGRRAISDMHHVGIVHHTP